jgi:hypothetical protein
MGYKEDLSKVEGSSFEDIPAGKYLVKVIESSIQDNKDKTGKVWQMTLQIQDGKYKNRLLWYKNSMGEKSAPFRKGALTALKVDTSVPVDYEEDVINLVALADVYIDPVYGNKVKMLRTYKPMTADDVLNSFTEDCPF